ncbi:hypothetical protein GCM10009603_67290 [Nocardiopsis exhalans]
MRLARVALTAPGPSGAAPEDMGSSGSGLDSVVTVVPPDSVPVAVEEPSAVDSAVSTSVSPAVAAASDSLLVVFRWFSDIEALPLDFR